MASPDSEERIRELEQRMADMPGSRIFVGLAEEYRRAGRYGEALDTLKKGLEAHPTYLSAQIALARLYQETWRTNEAIEAFSKVLTMDRENLVAAKALSDLYENDKNPVEAIKKLKLYRALSGDKAADDRIAKMERDIRGDLDVAGPAGSEAAAVTPEPLPAADVAGLSIPPAIEENFDPNQTMSIGITHYEAPQNAVFPEAVAPAEPSATAPPSPGDPSLHSGPPPSPSRERAETPEPVEGVEGEGAAAEPAIPASRTLADLYYTQGFVDDARKIYEKLAVANPMDESVTRRLRVLRNPVRQKKARVERWLARVQANARSGAGRPTPGH